MDFEIPSAGQMVNEVQQSFVGVPRIDLHSEKHRGPDVDRRMTTTPPTTTDSGNLVASDEHSLTVGPDGPILLQDHYAIEQMAQWNRERVPERQPHAKGSGAFGKFEVTGDVSAYTKA